MTNKIEFLKQAGPMQGGWETFVFVEIFPGYFDGRHFWKVVGYEFVEAVVGRLDEERVGKQDLSE
jgi:hypothetical protein